MNKYTHHTISARDKLQSEKDEKQILLDWNRGQQRKPLLKKYHQEPDILSAECETIVIDGKHGESLRIYRNYVSEQAAINETIKGYIEYMVLEPFYRDIDDDVLLGIYTKDYDGGMDKPIDFFAINIFDTIYIIEKKDLQGKSYDAVYEYFHDLIHNAIDLHAYSTMSLANMVKVKENYPTIKDYDFQANQECTIQQKIVDIFHQTKIFDTATYMSLLRNVESSLLSHIDEIYKPDVKKDLYKVLLLGFLYTYYNKQYYFMKEGLDKDMDMEALLLTTFHYKITGVIKDAVYTIDNIIEALYNGKGGWANYCGGVYETCVFRYLGKIGANMNKMKTPSINDIIHTISVDMQDKSLGTAEYKNINF